MNELALATPIVEAIADPPRSEWIADPRALVWRGPTGEIAAVSRRDGRALEVLIANLAVFTLRDGSDVPTARVHGGDPASLLDLYRRFALPIFLQARGAEVVHASAVLTPRGVLAFLGPSGCGKSTLAYALAQRGFTFWADDTLAIAKDPIGALKIPARPRLCRDTAEYFGLTSPPEPSTTSSRAPIAAFIALDHGEIDPPALVRLGANDAFLALFNQAFTFDLTARDRNEAMLSTYFDLAEQIPVHRLTHRRRFEDLRALVDMLARFGEHGEPGEFRVG